MVNATGFRCQAARLFLTTPTCPVEKEEALRQWKQACTTDVIEYIVCVEKHEDGSPHLHAFLRLDRKVNIKNPRLFDLKGEDGRVYHTRIEGCRSPKKVKDYVKKDGDFIQSEGMVEPEGNYAAAMALAKEGKVDEAKELLSDKEPKDSILRSSEISKGLQAFAPTPEYKGPPHLAQFVVPDELDAAVQMLGKKSLVISGPSGIGKTRFARSLFPKHHFITCMDQLRSLVSGQALVFDDMDFADMSRSAVLQLIDQDDDRRIRCRYSDGVIKANTPKVFLTNLNTMIDLFGVDDKAIKRRVNWVSVTKPMYDLKEAADALAAADADDEVVDVEEIEGGGGEDLRAVPTFNIPDPIPLDMNVDNELGVDEPLFDLPSQPTQMAQDRWERHDSDDPYDGEDFDYLNCFN